MGIQLTDEELWAFVATSWTGILTTLRRDGTPVPVPLWFVVTDERTIATTTLARSKKVSRLRRDPRATFLVESGRLWTELKAAILVGHAQVVDDQDIVAGIQRQLDAKYPDALGVARDERPDATKAHYAASQVGIRFEATEPAVTWDNAKIRL